MGEVTVTRLVPALTAFIWLLAAFAIDLAGPLAPLVAGIIAALALLLQHRFGGPHGSRSPRKLSLTKAAGLGLFLFILGMGASTLFSSAAATRAFLVISEYSFSIASLSSFVEQVGLALAIGAAIAKGTAIILEEWAEE